MLQRHKTSNRLVALLLAVLLTWYALPASAHPLQYQVIRTALTAQDHTLDFTTELAAVIRPDLGERVDLLQRYYTDLFKVRYRGQECPVTVAAATVDVPNPRTTIRGRFTCPAAVTDPQAVRLEVKLFSDLIATYNHFIQVQVGGQTRELVLNRDQYTDQPQASAVAGFWSVIGRFFKLGVEHILLGFDHVLFLLAVILVIRSLRDTIGLVTSFTIAHSITLLLAGLGIVTLPGRLVEPVIAASIAYVALRNLSILKSGSMGKLRERWLTTFGFGLVHGLGLAGALREIEIPGRYFVPTLLTFNVGVEVGQLLILTVALPLLWLLANRVPKLRQRVLIALSTLISIIAVLWLIERIVRA